MDGEEFTFSLPSQHSGSGAGGWGSFVAANLAIFDLGLTQWIDIHLKAFNIEITSTANCCLRGDFHFGKWIAMRIGIAERISLVKVKTRQWKLNMQCLYNNDQIEGRKKNMKKTAKCSTYECEYRTFPFINAKRKVCETDEYQIFN